MSMNAKISSGALASLLSLSLTAPLFGLDGSVSADYVKSFEPADPTIGMNLSLSESLNEKWSLGLSQSLTKNLVIDSETDEWVLSDTRISLRLGLDTKVEGLGFAFDVSSTLPVSKSSQHQEIYSSPQLGVSGSYSPREGWSFSAGAFIRDTISAYETAPAEEGAGGSLIADYSYGMSHSMTLSGGGFSGGYSASYIETHFYKQERSATETRDFRIDLPSQGYSLSVFVARELWTGAEVNVSFIQGSLLAQAGYEDYVFYDSAESQYSFGFSQSF